LHPMPAVVSLIYIYICIGKLLTDFPFSFFLSYYNK
jgi:hypothetical protein